MLERVVHYLHSHDVPFRLSSYPSPEPLPGVAYRLPPGGVMVETSVLLVDGQPTIACVVQGAKLNLASLENELGMVVEGSAEDLPSPFKGAGGPTPPLGRAMGLLTLIDEAVAMASAVVFAAFSSNDIVEIPYDDFSRLEQPRVASFAAFGELPESSGAGESERKVA